MQPNIVTGNRNQLGQYPARSNYGYEVPANAYRSSQRTMSNSGLVHQNTTMNCIPNNYAPGPAVYSNLLAGNVGNVSDSVHILQPTPHAVAVKFRTIPFDKLKYEILKPSLLTANHQITLPPNAKTSATQEFHFAFIMTCAMASEISMNRDTTKNEYCVQAQLRITAFDTTTADRPAEYDDFLPLGLVIRLNGRQCTQLPPCTPSTRQGQETRRTPRPIFVTHLIKISPMNPNIVTINWAAENGKQFVITMNVIEKLSADFLMTNLKEKPGISVDVTKSKIQQQYKPDGSEKSSGKAAEDDECAPTILRASLLCPLAKFRIQYPARGKYCPHLQCFDGFAFISLNEKKTMWNCPVCNKALFYDDLLLDEYFMEILRNGERLGDCQEVLFLPDGSWKVEDGRNEDKNTERTKSNSTPNGRQLTNSPDDNDKGRLASSSESGAEGTVSNNDVVNLLSDDEDESEVEVANETVKEAANEGGDSANREVVETVAFEAAANEIEMSINEAGSENASLTETNAEAQLTPPEHAEANKESNSVAGIISLEDSPPPVAGLSIG